MVFGAGVYFLTPNDMPNHCYNSLKIGSNAKEILAAIKGKDTCFDFNKIIPMPEELVDTKAPPDKPNRALIRKYGYDNWCRWSIANWDTKWNTYETEVQEHTVHFLTAWGPPINVIRTLSRKYPKVEFYHYYDTEGYEGPGYETLYRNGKAKWRTKNNF